MAAVEDPSLRVAIDSVSQRPRVRRVPPEPEGTPRMDAKPTLAPSTASLTREAARQASCVPGVFPQTTKPSLRLTQFRPPDVTRPPTSPPNALASREAHGNRASVPPTPAKSVHPLPTRQPATPRHENHHDSLRLMVALIDNGERAEWMLAPEAL